MKKALIFGIGGFVGPYLARELQSNGYKVYGADTRKEEESIKYDGYFQCNILDKFSIKKIIMAIQPTHIINLAAISSVGQSWKIPDVTMRVNVNGTLNIFDACLLIGIKPRILLIGSSEEYISCNNQIDEKTQINANNPYGISKVAQEQFAKIYREKYNWNIFCVRSFNHIGVGQNNSFVISSWCKQLIDIEKGIQDPIIKVGNIDVYRDFTDVRDIVKAYRLIIESNFASTIFNVGSGISYYLKDILEFILSKTKEKISIQISDEYLRPNDNKFICCNPSLIKEKLKWEAKYSILDTIIDIINSFK